MTQQQRQKALNHVQKHWGNKPCPCCGSNSWGVEDELGVVLKVEGQDINATSGYPFVIGRCSNCQYSIFFNAVGVGVYP